MATNIGIWPGSGSAISGTTNFGTWDDDADFQTDGPKVAKWIAMSLGFPIMKVELSDIQMYGLFEESIGEYSTQINNANMENWLLNYFGTATGSANSKTGKFPVNTFGFSKRYAQSVATEVGVGGEFDWKSGSVTLTSGVQEYDLQALWGVVSESNARLEIKEIWHYPRAAMKHTSYSDTRTFVDVEFGSSFGAVPGVPAYFLYPMYHDVLRAQALELNDLFRKSNYSYEVINNKLRIMPTPTGTRKLFFRYTVNTNPISTDDTSTDDVTSGVADQANVPYEFIEYKFINSMGKHWVRKYTLALAKELLGHIRSKYSSIPIPEGEVTLNGPELISDGRESKEAAMLEIKELLEKTSNQSLMESEAETQEKLQSQLNKIPLLPYIGTFIGILLNTGIFEWVYF